MPLAAADREIISAHLDRALTTAEATLFENLWSEHCAYRSSRPLLSAFDSTGDQVVVGPGDDAAVVALPDADGETYVTMGVESHNHPSYVDPYDGAATGVGGIVRDTISMGAYPIALADALYFGEFDREHSRYLLEGVVDGIADYGNAIGVPTVTGSTAFHPDYEGNPLVNVACVGLIDDPDRLVRAGATTPGHKLVLVGNATGRDGLGGASFASEDLAEDAETEDRPAVQVGDPYTEKLLIEASELLVERELVTAARDLGAAGLGGASAEMAAIGGLGAAIDLEAVHQREPDMSGLEILLAESQERMCYEVAPDDVAAVREVAERFDLGCSVIGEVTDDGQYVCRFEGETIVDVPAEYLADGAPMHELDREAPAPVEVDRPDVPFADAVETVLSDPTTAGKRWVYRQYDHEVGVRTAVRPGDDAALLAIREATHPDGGPAAGDGASASPDADGPPVGLAFSAGASPNWTAADPYEGARSVAVENATNLAAVGATPLAAVDCLNGGNPETPAVYDGFAAAVEGLADACSALSVPVVGGNVSLYNDSAAGPIPPTPTVAMAGTRPGLDAPGTAVTGEGTLLLVGGHDDSLGGSAFLAAHGGEDVVPQVPASPRQLVEAIAGLARGEHVSAVHDVSDGGLAVTLAEMVGDAGVRATVPDAASAFCELPGRVVVETTRPTAVREAVDGVAPVVELGRATEAASLSLSLAEEEGAVELDADEIAAARDTLAAALD